MCRINEITPSDVLRGHCGVDMYHLRTAISGRPSRAHTEVRHMRLLGPQLAARAAFQQLDRTQRTFSISRFVLNLKFCWEWERLVWGRAPHKRVLIAIIEAICRVA